MTGTGFRDLGTLEMHGDAKTKLGIPRFDPKIGWRPWARQLGVGRDREWQGRDLDLELRSEDDDRPGLGLEDEVLVLSDQKEFSMVENENGLVSRTEVGLIAIVGFREPFKVKLVNSLGKLKKMIR
ncbi:hypothetical protein NL676_029572 [Syzygium grande]|nr:hypothetical protein NL676_029572 [Syzygium grande]